jgi:hypothetical protein
MFAANDLRSFGEPPVHPRRLLDNERLFGCVRWLDREGDVIERGLLKGLRIPALAVREPEVHQFRAPRPNALPSHRRESTLLNRQLIDPELIMQRDVRGCRRAL